MSEDGIVYVDKPAGITSFGVVARVRGMLSRRLGKKAKVGHTGTLDPFATGLMIIVTGKECRNAAQYTKLDKVYEATIELGKTSSTGDPEGELTVTSSYEPDTAMVERTLQTFQGEITQRPPMFSAIKIGGRRAYDLARKGEVFEVPERQVTIFSIELLDYTYPFIRIRTHVSSGTYIRTLAEDIGKALTTGAYCRELRRTKIGQWSVETAEPLDVYMS